MFRAIGIICVLQFLAITSAYACDGQPGKVIFEDKFADDSGGWDFTPPDDAVKPPVFVFALSDKYTNMSSQNLTFHATDGDFCVEAALPKAVAADDIPYVGIEFWATDYANYMLLQLSAKGDLALYSKVASKWQQIFSVQNAPGFKADPGASNALRVNTVGGKITAYLNGKLVKAVRAQVPSGDLKFGVYAQWDKKAAHPPINVTSFKVTSGQ